MSNDFKIKLTIEGMHHFNGDPDLDSFVSSAKDFRDILKEVEKNVKGSKQGGVDLRVVDLSHSSPATITIEALHKSGGPDVREIWMETVNRTLHTVSNGTEIDALPIPVIKKVKSLSKRIGKKIAALRISTSQDVVSLDTETFRIADRALENFREYNTSYTGTLETIDFHAGTNKFVIYPENGMPEKISCTFLVELSEIANEAVRKRVKVTGVGRFLRGNYFPTLIKVDKIQVLPTKDQILSLSDLHKSDPDIVGEDSSEDFVRRLRDEWD